MANVVPIDQEGRKFDNEKERFDLISVPVLRALARVLTYGARKYAPENWRLVPEWRRRYYAAAMRHVTAWYDGEANDAETGESHLAHAICCLMFLFELDRESKR